MKSLKIGKSIDLDAVNPKNFAIVIEVGGGDTLLKDGNDVLASFKEQTGEKASGLTEALTFYTKDNSRNGYEMLLAKDGTLYSLDWV